MITCRFENNGEASLRHIVTHAIVEKNGALLLTKRAEGMLEGGKWGLPGGFLDRDETAAEGVLRELKEETGWEGEVITLFRVNTRPNRPHEDRQNVALDFIVKPIRQVAVPDQESSKVEWIPFEKLLDPEQFAFDHGESIAEYLRYRSEKFSVPLLI